MEQLDKNQSYFFLFEKEEYTMEQVRTFILELFGQDLYQQCEGRFMAIRKVQ